MDSPLRKELEMWCFKIMNGRKEAIYEWTFPTKAEALAFMEKVSNNPKAVGHNTGRWHLEEE